MYALAYPLLALVQILDTILFIYTIVIVASVVVSWVNADPYNPLVKIIHSLTEPVFRRVRSKIKTVFGAFDFTPIIILLLIMFVQQGILPVVTQFAAGLR